MFISCRLLKSVRFRTVPMWLPELYIRSDYLTLQLWRDGKELEKHPAPTKVRVKINLKKVVHQMHRRMCVMCNFLFLFIQFLNMNFLIKFSEFFIEEEKLFLKKSDCNAFFLFLFVFILIMPYVRQQLVFYSFFIINIVDGIFLNIFYFLLNFKTRFLLYWKESVFRSRQNYFCILSWM